MDSTGGTTFKGKPLYNFYNHTVSVTFNIASIAGTPQVSPPASRNCFFVSIGQDASNNLSPFERAMDYGQGIRIELVNEGVGGTYWRMIGVSLNNSSEVQTFLYRLSALPTAVTYTFSGTKATISLTGATFTFDGTNSTSVTFQDLSKVAAFNQYNLAFGAYNYSDVATKTIVTLDAFSAEVSE